MDIIKDKEQLLKDIIQGYKRLLIAFSGGLDSSFLLKIALEVLGRKNVLAVTAYSESISNTEFVEAIRIANLMNASHKIILTNEFANPEYLKNTSQRCYFCKNELFTKLKEVALLEDFKFIAYGAIVDDEGDFRPGMTAAEQHQIEAPLQKARLTKTEIRILAKEMPFSNKPANPCLASRVPHGEIITPQKMQQIDQAEKILKELGFNLVRVRHHDRLARIETSLDELYKIFNPDCLKVIVSRLKALGYTYVALDLEGYRQGSSNLVLKT